MKSGGLFTPNLVCVECFLIVVRDVMKKDFMIMEKYNCKLRSLWEMLITIKGYSLTF